MPRRRQRSLHRPSPGPRAAPLPRRQPARDAIAAPARAAGQRVAVPPQLPLLLALRHAADVPRRAQLVPERGAAQGAAAGAHGRVALGAGLCEREALCELAGRGARLGDLAQPLLGHAAPGVERRARRRDCGGGLCGRVGGLEWGARAKRFAPGIVSFCFGVGGWLL